MLIEKIGLIANPAKEKSPALTVALRDWLRARGLTVLLEREIAAIMDEGEAAGLSTAELAAQADLLLVLGGDGTLLRTARAAAGMAIPIAGINLGAFGYLTEINTHEAYSALEIILAGQYQVEKRMMLEVVVRRQRQVVERGVVLNDAVINRSDLSRLVHLETAVDKRYLTTFKADGLIVSTPTGSTAYSLSAGGPIVFPQHDSIILNPICPHSLTNRPVVLPRKAVVTVGLWTKEGARGGATLTLDGQVSFTLHTGDSVTIRRSRHATHLVTSPHRDYVEILRSKLGWGGQVGQEHKE